MTFRQEYRANIAKKPEKSTIRQLGTASSTANVPFRICYGTVWIACTLQISFGLLLIKLHPSAWHRATSKTTPLSIVLHWMSRCTQSALWELLRNVICEQAAFKTTQFWHDYFARIDASGAVSYTTSVANDTTASKSACLRYTHKIHHNCDVPITSFPTSKRFLVHRKSNAIKGLNFKFVLKPCTSWPRWSVWTIITEL